ncbi:MAG: class I SAM-dependent methyltransferase [Deltaproteobacteria bacterium]|nr:class I SAM-dependent methyltransferase [Deltaproteobacteria bacterium]
MSPPIHQGTLNYLERFLVNHPLRFLGQKFIDIPVLENWGRLPKGASILEAGCGNGRVARYLSGKLKAKNYTAIDIDPKMIAQAESLTEKNSRLIFQVADLCDLPFDNNCFDAVIVLDVLHHLVDWKRGVREVNRVLKKGGKLCLREYSLETFSMPILGLILRALLDHPYEFMFDQPELLSFIRKHGFEITHQNDMSWLLMLVAVKK